MTLQVNKSLNLIMKRNQVHYCNSTMPFVQFYERHTQKTLDAAQLLKLKRKIPNIELLCQNRLQSSLQILNKFDIKPEEACKDPHIFSMNPVTMDNYGEILKECGFIKILPKYIINYHTLVRKKYIQQFKDEGILAPKLKLTDRLINQIKGWPKSVTISKEFKDADSTILKIRMFILGTYLQWKLSATAEDFEKYCRLYLPVQHKPLSDIQETIDLAQREVGFDSETIRRNGFIISTDPVNIKMILENVPILAGMDIREVMRLEPAVIKNNFNSLLEIQSILDEYEISKTMQQSCLRVYCMQPITVRERLEELKSTKEFEIFNTNPRILLLVVHKRKLDVRLNKLREANKQCYGLNHLISSRKIFNDYIDVSGSKVSTRDIGTLVIYSLNLANELSDKEKFKLVQNRMKRHKYCSNIALNIIYENIKLLQKYFRDDVIFNNCQLLLYQCSDIEFYLKQLLQKREDKSLDSDSSHSTLGLDYTRVTDDQIISLILYEIEKKYHFSHDGVWSQHKVS